MPDTPNQPEPLWETELRDATNDIPDTETTPGSPRERDNLWEILDWSFWGNGMGDEFREALADKMCAVISDEEHAKALELIRGWRELRGEPNGQREYERLRDENKKLRNEMAVTRTWLQDELSSVRAQLDEAHAENRRLHAQKAMARAEVDELRARIAEAHKVADTLHKDHPEIADFLYDALNGPKPDPAREAALNEMAYESARETTDFAAHWPYETRDKDSVRYVQCAYDSFPGLEGGRCISNATDGPYCKPHADAIAEYDATNRKEK